MKYFVSAGIVLLIGLALLSGCATSGLKISQADQAFEEGKMDEALALYLRVLEQDPDGKYANYAHFQIAEIYKNRDQWDEALKHYQAIVDRATTGYYAARARSRMADVRKLRDAIQQALNAWNNRIMDTESGRAKAAQALLTLGDAYNTLENYGKAIQWYKTFVETFPDHERAAQIQFKIGNIYFYKLYDYEKGWPEFTKLIQDEHFKDTYEAKEAARLLKKVKAALDSIKQDMDYIAKYRREKAIEYAERGRKVTQFAKYSVYAEQIAKVYLNIGRAWENEPLRNLPNAIKVYQEMADELPQERSAAAEALFKVAELNQQLGRYEEALKAYDILFERAPDSFWRDQAVYNQAICYEAIRQFSKAYERYKAYMSLGEDKEFYRAAEQKVRQFEYDEDGDGYPFYKEQEAGTSDKDPNSYPGSQPIQAKK